MSNKSIYAKLFLVVSVLSTVYLFAEAVLQLFGTSICATEGCKVVAQHTRFGDISIVLTGLVTLSLLTALSALNFRSPNTARENLISLILVVSLAGEGFFTGYQLFRLNTFCVFCVSVLGIMTALGVLRLLAGRKEAVAGFASLVAVLALFYLVLPAGGVSLPLDKKLTLFYSPDCKHCAEIREEIEKNRIEVEHVQVKEYSATLGNLGIEHVPTLFVNGPYEKILLTGKDAIRRYLFCEPKDTAASKKRTGKTKTAPPEKASPPKKEEHLNLLAPLGTTEQIFTPQPDEGLCKEEQKCE